MFAFKITTGPTAGKEQYPLILASMDDGLVDKHPINPDVAPLSLLETTCGAQPYLLQFSGYDTIFSKILKQWPGFS